MSLKDDISAMINDMDNKRALWKERAMNAAQTRFKSTADKVYQQFGEYQRQKITEIFNGAVSSFYRAYTPEVYHRTHSLYNLLHMPLDERRLVDYDQAINLIDREKIHRDRANGYSLFETVFMEGWHGGSKSISRDKERTWGTHPQPGTPYYRKPGNVTYPDSGVTKRHRYGKWGRVAFKSEAPYSIFEKELRSAEGGEIYKMFQDISSSNWDILCKNLQSDLTVIKKEIFG